MDVLLTIGAMSVLYFAARTADKRYNEKLIDRLAKDVKL